MTHGPHQPVATPGRGGGGAEDPLTQEDRYQGWTDDLRREIQEEISLSRSALRRHGLGVARYLRPRLEEWLDRVGVAPGRLRGLVSEAQRCLETVDSDTARMAE